jgi:hypothetical protein
VYVSGFRVCVLGGGGAVCWQQQLWEGLSGMGLQPYVENDADR